MWEIVQQAPSLLSAADGNDGTGNERTMPMAQEETQYGYPIPPDNFSELRLDEIRRLGKMAIATRAEVDVESSDGQVDTGWVIDAMGWSSWVLELVVEAIGGDDQVLLAYSHDTWSHANEEIEAIQRELAIVTRDSQQVNWLAEGF